MRRVVVVVLIASWGSLTAGGNEDRERPRKNTFKEQVYRYLEKRREMQLQKLHEYLIAGQFPVTNGEASLVTKDDPHFDPKRPRTHCFIDPKGVLCALANLIAQSGHRDLVDRIAKSKNHFCIASGNNDSVTAWILSSGLTLEECVQIQRPGYRGGKTRAPLKNPKYPMKKEDPIALNEPVKKTQRVLLQEQLLKVEAKLRKDSESSLRIAVDRFLDHLQRYTRVATSL